MNTPAVTQAAVQRAIRAAQALGQPIAGVRLRPDRSVEILFGEPQPLTPGAAPSPSNDLDDELEAFKRSHGYS